MFVKNKPSNPIFTLISRIGKHVDTVFPNGKICCSYVFVLLCIGKVVFEYGSAKRIDLAVESVRPASPLGGEVAVYFAIFSAFLLISDLINSAALASVTG